LGLDLLPRFDLFQLLDRNAQCRLDKGDINKSESDELTLNFQRSLVRLLQATNLVLWVGRCLKNGLGVSFLRQFFKSWPPLRKQHLEEERQTLISLLL
jgi:hypothetical protein